MMNPNNDIYGMSGFNLQGIEGFNMQKPTIKGTAVHKTYDKKERDKLYNSNTPWGSYGCTNMPDGEMQCLTNDFPKGDTMVVVDSKMPNGQQFINSMKRGKLKYGGLQHVNYFGPPFSNGAKMDFTNGQKLDMRKVRRIVDNMLKMKAGGLTPNKAREILHDGTAHGQPLSDKQRRFFGAKSKGHTNYRGKK